MGSAPDPCEGWDLPPWVPGHFDLREELNSNPRLNADDLKKLHSWASKKKNLPHLKEAELVKFLHSCEYNVNNAQKCIESYYSMRSWAPELFRNRDITSEDLMAQLKVLDILILPKKTPDGCRIFFARLKRTVDGSTPSKYVFADHQKIMLMVMDACLLAEPTIPNFYLVYDLHQGQLNHFWRFGVWLQRKLFAYFQAGLPLLLRGVILLNSPPFITNIMKILTTFVNKQRLETTKMFWEEDFAPLYDVIPKECLPSDYGGTLPSVEDLHNMTVERLKNLRDYFKEEEERDAKGKKK